MQGPQKWRWWLTFLCPQFAENMLCSSETNSFSGTFLEGLCCSTFSLYNSPKVFCCIQVRRGSCSAHSFNGFSLEHSCGLGSALRIGVMLEGFWRLSAIFSARILVHLQAFMVQSINVISPRRLAFMLPLIIALAPLSWAHLSWSHVTEEYVLSVVFFSKA